MVLTFFTFGDEDPEPIDALSLHHGPFSALRRPFQLSLPLLAETVSPPPPHRHHLSSALTSNHPLLLLLSGEPRCFPSFGNRPLCRAFCLLWAAPFLRPFPPPAPHRGFRRSLRVVSSCFRSTPTLRRCHWLLRFPVCFFTPPTYSLPDS